MCDCKSCIETMKYSDKPFAQWPKGDRPPSSVYGRAKIPKDKAYQAHWLHCGAEAHRTRAKLDMRQYIPPTPRATVNTTPASPRPTPVKFPHTRLNEPGWRERMLALNEQSREPPCTV